MIMPNKVVKPNYSLLYIGGYILDTLVKKRRFMYLDELFSDVKVHISYPLSLERFLLALDFLYVVGKIELDNDKVLICA